MDKIMFQPFLHVEEFADDPALIMGEQTVTYRELLAITSSTAEDLRILGVKRGDRIAICSPNDVSYVVILLSLFAVGAIACPLNTQLPVETIESQIKKLQAQYLLTSRFDLLTSESVSIKRINLSNIIQYQIFDPAISRIKSLAFPLDQEATILFTSGSSSQPKAALHTIGNHYYNALASNDNIPLKRGDHWLLSLPLYHVSGISIIFKALLSNAKIVIPNPGETIIQTILQYNVTHISLVSTQLYRLLEDRSNEAGLRTLSAILLGGGPISESLIERALALSLPIYISYGLTETASQVATSPKLTNDRSSWRAKILKHSMVKISDEREILIKGEILFKGYVTEHQIKLPLDKEGWFHTGDLGLLIEGNYLMVRGRKDNMFVSGGENIQPEEIEQLLCQMEGVEQAIVVPAENREFGYRPVAFIREDTTTKIKREELITALKDKLPKYKIPDEFYRWLKDWEIPSIKASRQRLTLLVKNNNPDLKVIS